MTLIYQKIDFKTVTIKPNPDMSWPLYDYFKYFINDEMLSNIVYQTNLYTTQKNVKSINTDAKELEQLIGVYLCMGLVKMPNQLSY